MPSIHIYLRLAAQVLRSKGDIPLKFDRVVWRPCKLTQDNGPCIRVPSTRRRQVLPALLVVPAFAFVQIGHTAHQKAICE